MKQVHANYMFEVSGLSALRRDVKILPVSNSAAAYCVLCCHTAFMCCVVLSKSIYTPPHTAPEVLGGGPYNHAADWWSLGILLYALATGKVSFNFEQTSHTFILYSIGQTFMT